MGSLTEALYGYRGRPAYVSDAPRHNSRTGRAAGNGSNGVHIEVNYELLEDERKRLNALSLLDTKFEEKAREFIRKELAAAREEIINSIKFKNGDPRGARFAIRRATSNKMLKGSIWLPPMTQAGQRNSYEPPRKLQAHKRGGNRMIRSIRTDDIMHYGSLDRGWILRIVNAGTHPRYANGRNGNWNKARNRVFERLQRIGDYYRSSIAPRNFFHKYGSRAMDKALQNIRKMIEEESERIIND
jgi:hypothetical protein